MGNEDRKAIFARNFSYLCGRQTGGTWFIAEKLLGVSRESLWSQGRNAAADAIQEVTSAKKRLDRWCAEGVVRFDSRTRQDFATLQEVLGLESIEDLWREDLIDELIAQDRQKRLGDNSAADCWAEKLWHVCKWYEIDKLEKGGLLPYIEKLWQTVPAEAKSKHYREGNQQPRGE
jgi:hypothetical protein